MTTEKADVETISTEKVDVAIATTEAVSASAIQARFDILCDLNEEQMAALNKRVLRRIDWRMMPTITVMFLLK